MQCKLFLVSLNMLFDLICKHIKLFVCFRFLRNHCCIPKKYRKVKQSFEQWREIRFHCRDLGLNLIESVECSKKCKDPIKCSTIKGVRGKPVFWEEIRKDKNGVEHKIELPVSCKCEKVNRRRHHYKSKRQRRKN